MDAIKKPIRSGRLLVMKSESGFLRSLLGARDRLKDANPGDGR